MIRVMIFSLVGLTFLVTGCQEASKPTRTTCNPTTHVLAADGKTCVGKPAVHTPPSSRIEEDDLVPRGGRGTSDCDPLTETTEADGSCTPKESSSCNPVTETTEADGSCTPKESSSCNPVTETTEADGSCTPKESSSCNPVTETTEADGSCTPKTVLGEPTNGIVLTSSQSTFLVDPSGRANCFSQDLQIPQGLEVELSTADQPDSPSQIAVVIKTTGTGCSLTRAFLFEDHWTGWPASQ